MTNIFVHLKMTTDIFLYHINGFIWKLAMQWKWDITTRKICTLLLRSTSQEFPWRVTFCTLCYLWAIHKRYLVENICVRKKEIESVRKRKKSMLNRMHGWIYSTNNYFLFEGFDCAVIFQTNTHINGIQQSFKLCM